jgi:uncharacterized protein YcaQ
MGPLATSGNSPTGLRSCYFALYRQLSPGVETRVVSEDAEAAFMLLRHHLQKISFPRSTTLAIYWRRERPEKSALPRRASASENQSVAVAP